MANQETVLLSVEDRIAILTIYRPKALNALNKQVFDALDLYFSDTLPNMDIDGIIITGSGEKAFVAGADITEFVGLSEAEGEAISVRGQSVFRKIELFPKPVVALVNGFALGGGCELALACHLRVATPNARFGQPEVNLGLIPGYGATQRLVQIIGKSKAIELLLTGDMVNADAALQMGLTNKVANPEEALEIAVKWIKKIASKGPKAIAKIIKTVDAYFNSAVDGYEVEQVNFGKMMGSAESTEGINAFLEKRKAAFK